MSNKLMNKGKILIHLQNEKKHLKDKNLKKNNAYVFQKLKSNFTKSFVLEYCLYHDQSAHFKKGICQFMAF